MADSAEQQISAIPLLRAKLLQPTLDAQHLKRPRLLRRLGKGIDHRRVTVVTGGPGSGKTSLVASYLDDDAADAVWYRLDGGDRDPRTFYAYLVEALRGASKELGERSEGLIQELRSRPDEIERLADVLIRDVEDALSGRIHVVLDRVEFLEDAELCLRLLHRIVEYLPDALHLILVGRSIPDVGLHGLSATGSALVLPPDELLLTRDETRALLCDRLGVELGDERIGELHERTRGWVTAIKLFHQAGGGGGEADVGLERAGRTPREVLDYFSEEVLAAEPPATQAFLLGASLPSVLEPEVLDEVLERDDASRVTAQLHQRGLFLSTLGGADEVYSFDPLFREFLDRKLREERGAESVRALHRAFGRAFLSRRRIAEALRHHVAADDAAAAGAILNDHGRDLLTAGLMSEVGRAAEMVAETAPSPQAHDLLGETARLAGDYAAAVGHFQQALDSTGPHALVDDERAAALQGLSFARLKLGQLDEAARAAEEALDTLGDRNPALRARVLNTRSIVRYREGAHDVALEGWREAMAAAREGRDEHLTLMVAHNLGLPHAVAGDFRRAAECFRMLTSDSNRRLGPEEAAAHLNLARIATLTGDLREASRRLDDAQEIAGRLKLGALLGDVLEAEGNLARAGGRFEAAAAKYAEARMTFTALGLHGLLDNLTEEEALLASRSGEHQRALQLGAELVEAARRADDPLGLAGAQLTFGEIAIRAGSPADALEPLDLAAAAFAAAGRAYGECQARLWRGAANGAIADARDRARADVEAAVALAGRYGYEALVAEVIEAEPRVRPLVDGAAPGVGLAPAAARPPEESDAIDPPDLTIRLLGGLEVYRDPQHVVPPAAWKIKKAPKLLAFLVASRGHRASKDRLIDAVWGDAPAATVKKNFHPTVSFLRRALNHGHTVPKNFIVFEAGSYRLNPAYRYEIDVDVFEDGVRDGREVAGRREVRGALAAYDRALAAYGGPFLDEWDEEWVEGPRTRTSQLHEAALAEVADLHFAAGDTEAAIGRLAELVALSPLDEGAAVQLIEALADAGRRGEVEREYRRLERSLAETLDVEPSEETREAYRDALGRSGDG